MRKGKYMHKTFNCMSDMTKFLNDKDITEFSVSSSYSTQRDYFYLVYKLPAREY